MNFRFNLPYLLLLILFLGTCNTNGQTSQEVKFAEPTAEELGSMSYPKDPETAAIILYEKGETKVKVIGDYLKLTTEVHRKIKVLDARAYGDGVIEIPFYGTSKGGEKVTHVKALTHNGKVQQYVGEDDFFVKEHGGAWNSYTFTFPNIKDQSVLEYTYTLESPYFHNFNWYFQEEYPKLYSEYITEIPGNYEYRIGFRGFLKFTTHNQYIKKSCFSIRGYGRAADCYYNKYVIKDIPAFKKEEFMLSEDNYLSQLRYEMKQSTNLSGQRNFYTKEWEDVDEEFQYDKEMGRQLKNKNYFRRQLPESIFSISDPLEKAKAIFYYIQNHFTWNGNYRIFNDIDVKEAYEKGAGNSADINLALLNALQAADLKAHIALSATRSQSVPTELYPVLTEFNYVMAFLKIGKETYFLDATDKYSPFGVIPFKALNYRARIMDFEIGSYWHPITPYDKNQHYINVRLNFNEESSLEGEVQEIHAGYFSQRARETRSGQSEESFLEARADGFVIDKYRVENLLDKEAPLKELFSVEKEVDEIAGKYYLNPYFLLPYFNESPFSLEERQYPIDFGYTRNITYLLSLDLGEEVSATFLPENRNLVLPDNLGSCQVMYQVMGNTVNIRFQYRLNKAHLGAEYYSSLKAFYSEIIAIKNKDVLVLERS